MSTLERKAELIDALFRELYPADQPGVALGIYQGARSLLLRGYGVADLEQTAPIIPQTVFHVASVSKQFTTFAIALLARAGKIDLDADIRRYLAFVPDFGSVITVRDLIHNTSGLRDQWSLFAVGGQEIDNRLRQQQVCNMVARQRALNFAPGTQFLYSNTNFTLLAEIVRAVSGQTLREFTSEHMFRPLGMERTFFYDDVTEVVRGRAHSYQKDAATGQWRRALLNYDNAGATSLFTTVEDFARWSGNFTHPIVGDRALIAQMTATPRLADGTPSNYGFALWRAEYAGHQAIEHSGGDAGFRTWFACFPADDFGLAIFANRPLESFPRLIHAIVDVYLNGGRPGDSTHVPPALTPDARTLDNMTGSYVAEYAALAHIERAKGTDGPETPGLVFHGAGLGNKPVVFRDDGTFDLGDALRHSYSYVPQHDPQGRVTAFDDITTRLGGIGHVSLTYTRVELRAVPASALSELAGRYRSEELDVTHEISVRDSRLEVHSLWWVKPLPLTPTLPDRFDADHAIFSVFVFCRNDAGRISGFLLHGGRMRGVLFQRLSDPTEPAPPLRS